MRYFAHSGTPDDKGDWHFLSKHLRDTASNRLAAELAAYAILGHHAGLPGRVVATADQCKIMTCPHVAISSNRYEPRNS